MLGIDVYLGGEHCDVRMGVVPTYDFQLQASLCAQFLSLMDRLVQLHSIYFHSIFLFSLALVNDSSDTVHIKIPIDFILLEPNEQPCDLLGLREVGMV